MIRAFAYLLALWPTLCWSQTVEPYQVGLRAALEALAEATRDMQSRFGPGDYDVRRLTTEGLLIRTSPGGTALNLTPHLVGSFDHDTGNCVLGYDIQGLGNVSRDAAFAIRAAIRAEGWPVQLEAPVVWEEGPCAARAALAITFGGYEMVDGVRLDHRTFFFAFNLSEGTS